MIFDGCYKVELVREDLTLLGRSECELICFDVTLGTNKYRFVAVYRPPCSSFKNRDSLHAATNSLCTLMNNLCSTKLCTIIVGDFNLPKIDWVNCIAAWR